LTQDNLAETYQDDNTTQAIVIRKKAKSPNISFLTDPQNSFQMGLMTRNRELPVKLHKHNPIIREINDTQEFLLVRQGRMNVQLFDSNSYLNHEIELAEGDCILLCNGAHAIQFDEFCELLEIKQGPYAFEEDKEYIEH
jgi:mannose-6-phosphate isomerase-like protein (cupin superfamily)